MSLERIKKLGRIVNQPILENFGPKTDRNEFEPEKIIKHKSLSIPTEDDNVFNAANMEKGGHTNRHADKFGKTSDHTDVDPVNLPAIEIADDKKATAKVADMFHSLSTRRGLLKAKITGGDNSPETAQKLASINTRLANVSGLRDTVKRFEDK